LQNKECEKYILFINQLVEFKKEELNKSGHFKYLI